MIKTRSPLKLKIPSGLIVNCTFKSPQRSKKRKGKKESQMEFRVSPLTKIISLSGFLALGFLLVILSCALFHNYYPLFDILVFLLAPVPNALFSKSNADNANFMSDNVSNTQDTGSFLTGVLVTSGLALPFVFYHCQLIGSLSCIMCTLGGLIIYSSIVVFSWFFRSSWEQEDDALFG